MDHIMELVLAAKNSDNKLVQTMLLKFKRIVLRNLEYDADGNELWPIIVPGHPDYASYLACLFVFEFSRADPTP